MDLFVIEETLVASSLMASVVGSDICSPAGRVANGRRPRLQHLVPPPPILRRHVEKVRTMVKTCDGASDKIARRAMSAAWRLPK